MKASSIVASCIAGATALLPLACKLCARDREPAASTIDGAADSAGTIVAPPASSSAGAPGQGDEGPRIRGSWAGREFTARGAVADVFPKWVTITVFSRAVTCATATLRPTDMAVQFTIPSGPSADYFANRDLAVPIQLSGAGGVSAIPAGHVTVRINEVRVGNGSVVRGTLDAHFVTGSDPGAPRYDMQGPVEATVCSAQPAVASMPDTDRGQTPVRGKVAGREVKFPSVLAYTRPGADGRPILIFKAYPRDVDCHSVDRATPFLFGVEVGPGPRGDYHVGAPMPASWVIQLNDGHSGERSVHADDGAALLQLDAVETRMGGEVRGSLSAATLEETEASMTFSVSGTFKAKVCGIQQRAW